MLREFRVAFIRLQTICVLALFMAALAPHSAQAWTFKTLHSFCSQADCIDGKNPYARLLMDQTGTLYGTASRGGATGFGSAFALSPKAGTWSFKRLHSFCRKPSCSDGKNPEGGLIMDTAGNLYGTTYGENLGSPRGTVYELTPDGKQWKHTILRNFDRGHRSPQNPTGELSYSGKQAGDLYDGQSPLFGTTSWGGRCGGGTVFEVAPGSGGQWALDKLHSFGSNCAKVTDYNPWFGVVLGASGDIFGTTFTGGQGTLFKLSLDGDRRRETLLCTFGGRPPCVSGGDPVGPLIMDAAGNLIGVASLGGAHGAGVVFRLSPDGSQFTVLYDFCSLADCADGAYPAAGVTMDTNGNFFGTAVEGGDNNQGVAFKLSFNGTGWDETVLYSFCSRKHCRDGASPQAAIILDGANNLYGTTWGGGISDGGTVFELSP